MGSPQTREGVCLNSVVNRPGFAERGIDIEEEECDDWVKYI